MAGRPSEPASTGTIRKLGDLGVCIIHIDGWMYRGHKSGRTAVKFLCAIDRGPYWRWVELSPNVDMAGKHL